MRNKTWKRVLSICLAIALVIGTVPLDQFGLKLTKEVQAEAGDLPSEIATITDAHIPDSLILKYVKEKVNASLSRTLTSNITYGELKAYTGALKLSDIANVSQITTLQGLGLAKGASSIDMSGTAARTILAEEFSGCQMTSVTLPGQLTTIETGAFRDCSKLAAVTFPASVSVIGEAAFSGCKVLNGITFPASVTRIGKNCFESCEGLTSIAIPNANIDLGDGMFMNCSALSTIQLPEGMKKLPVSFLSGTKALTTINFPVSLVTIGNSSFSQSGINKVDLSKCVNLSSIESLAFQGADLSDGITFSEHLVTIGSRAFNASNLRTVSIPESVKKIEVGAFENCDCLFTVHLPNSMAEVPNKCFRDCQYLREVYIESPATSKLAKIGVESFALCASLKGTEFLKDLKALTDIEDRAFADCDAKLLSGNQYVKNRYGEFYETGELALDIDKALDNKTEYTGGRFEFENVVLPDCVIRLGSGVFAGSNNIKKAVLGSGITALPSETFSGCVMLEKIELPKKLETIGNSCFKNCRSLNTITFPEATLTALGDSAFEGIGAAPKFSSFTTNRIYVKKSLISYEPTGSTTDLLAYEQYQKTFKCEELASDNISYTGTYVRNVYMDESILINVNYKLTNPNDSSYIALYVDKKDMDSYTDEKNLTAVNIQGTNLLGYKELVLPESVTSIGKSCFYSSKALRSVKLPKNLTVIPDNAFMNCSYVLYSQAGESAYTYTYPGYSGSAQCKIQITEGLKSLELSDSVTKIGNYAFSGCTDLNSITSVTPEKKNEDYLPEKLVSIGNHAFNGDRNLGELHFGSELVSIGDFGFANIGLAISNVPVFQADNTEKRIKVVLPEFGSTTFDFSQSKKLASIGTFSFSYTNLTKVNLEPTSISVIPANTFEGASHMAEVRLPKTCTTIQNYAFMNCLDLFKVSVPGSTSIAETAFSSFCAYHNKAFSLESRNESPDNPDLPRISVSYGGEKVLPLHVFGNNTTTGDITLESKAGDPEIVEMNVTNGTTMDKVIALAGKEKKQQGIKISGNLSFPNLGRNALNMTVSMEYDVTVTEKECTSVGFQGDNFAVGIHNREGAFLNALVAPMDTTDTVEWESTSEDSIQMEPVMAQNALGKIVATAQAKITPVKYGTTPVTIKVGSKIATVNVQVVVPASAVRLNQNSMDLFQELTTTGKLTAAMEYNRSNSDYASHWADYPDRIRYTSSNPNLVAVDDDGNVSIVGTGTGDVTITAKAEGGGVYASCMVHVYPNHTEYHITDLSGVNEYTMDTEPVPIICDGVSKMMDFLVSKEPVDSSSPYEALSSDENVASVSYNKTESTLRVTGRHVGTSIISFGSKQGEQYGVTKFKIKVKADATDIQLLSGQQLAAGSTRKLFKSITSVLGTATTVEQIPSLTDNLVEFSSDNTAVATVNRETGEVTAVGEGTTTIHAFAYLRDGDIVQTSQEVKVYIPEATGVKINGSTSVKVGSTIQLGSELIPTTARNAVTYSVYGTSTCATVTPDGVVTGLKKGTVQVRVTTDNGRVATMTINVIQPALSITVANPNAKIKVGANFIYKRGTDYTINPTEYSTGDDIVTWTSQNPEIATVGERNGQIKGIAPGIATIILKTSYGLSASFTVEVYSPITGLTVNTEVTIKKGQDYQLTATLNPADTTESITWRSNNEKIATVDSNGVVHGVSKGNCYISVSSAGGKTANCKVTVTLPAKKVEFRTQMASQKKIYLARKKMLALRTILTPTDSTDTITYKSSKKKVVAVNSKTGMVTAKKKGTAKITARTSSGKKATITIVVINKDVSTKKLSIAKKKTIKRKKSIRLSPKVSPKSATDIISWTSSKPMVARVDSFGYVTGVKKGKAVITIRTPYAKPVTCKITVK